MSRSGAGWSRIAMQLRSLRQRSATGLLIGLSMILLVVGKVDVRLAAAVDDLLRDSVIPVLAVLRPPLEVARHGLDQIKAILATNEENRRLREENRLLIARDAEAAWLTVENRSLRRMLAVPATPKAPKRLTVRIVGDSGGGFVRALLIDAGREQGVVTGMPALAPEGLVGRVVDVGRTSARVLLVTDFNSRIPVVIAGSGDHAVLEGDNSALPRLRFLPLNPSFADGDRVLTSGRGGIIPPGLPVGNVRESGGQTRVTPLVDWSRLDYLTLTDPMPVPAPAVEEAAPAEVAHR